MNYQVDTPAQLRAVLKALRQARKLSQDDLGRLLGVNQKRIAKIEATPGVTGFDQLVRFVAALGGRFVIEDISDKSLPKPMKLPLKRASKRIVSTKSNW
jgi:HTH-type transcriptional regulator/antitoxin HipB